jgi:hypothetical protein
VVLLSGTTVYNMGVLQDLFDRIKGFKEDSSLQKLAKSSEEFGLIKQVAKEYDLDQRETKLLFAIRKAENGKQGLEFGVMNKEARRFAKSKDSRQSLVTQARWAAGTIDKRFTGDLEEFRDRYAPLKADNDPTGLNDNWLKNVTEFMGE